MTMTTRVLARFYDDHECRDLDTPRAVRRTKRHVWIDLADEHLNELLSDARYYADDYGPDTPGLRLSARALVKTIEAAQDAAGREATQDWLDSREG